MLSTLGAWTVVIWRRCTGETRPSGCSIAMRIWRLAGEGVDGGGAGVARGGADDGHLLAAPRQDLVEHRGQQLHREVLEGQGRPMEQLEQPAVAGEMAQGCGGGMVEVGIGAPGQPQQVGLVEAAHGERRQQRGRPASG